MADLGDGRCRARRVHVDQRWPHFDWLETIAQVTRRPVVIAALLHNSTNPGSVFKDLDAIEQANKRGRRLLGAVSCCPLSMDFTLHSPYVIEGLESWKPALPLKGEA